MKKRNPLKTRRINRHPPKARQLYHRQYGPESVGWSLYRMSDRCGPNWPYRVMVLKTVLGCAPGEAKRWGEAVGWCALRENLWLARQGLPGIFSNMVQP